MSDSDRLKEPPRFLRLPQVADRVGRSGRQIYRMVAAGDFPKPRRQSHRVSVWYENEVLDWQRQQMDVDQYA